MNIDIRTLIIVIEITYLIQVSIFFYQYKINKFIKGPGWWLLWSIAEVIMLALMFLRGIPSIEHFVIALQNVVAVSGMIFLYVGTLIFFEKKVNIKLLLSIFSIFLILHSYFNFVNDDLKIRIIIISLTFSLFSFLTAINILRFRNKGRALSAVLNAAVFIIYGTVFANRAIMIYLGVQPSEILSPSLLNSLTYIVGLVVSITITLGFIMMINDRLNLETVEAKAHFQLIFNISPDAIILSQLNDRSFLECNESFTRIFGYSKEEFSDISAPKINYWKNPEDRAEVIRLIKENETCNNYEASFLRKNGEVFTGLLSAKIMIVKEIQFLYSVIRDITERKEIEEELKHKNEELEILNVSKDKFFSIISHDLKSPFNVFLGYTELMVEESKDWALSKFKEYAILMRESATNFYRLLENLLEWSRMEQGLIPFSPTAIAVNLLIEESLAQIVDIAKSKEIEIISNITNDYQVLVDKYILQTVFRNLLSNAVKFTPRGGKIAVSVKVASSKMIQVSIQDSGIGMNSTLIGKLFKLDVQTKRDGTEKEPSTGLGLILCKDFIEKHKGEIWVESEEGKGSVFHFTIPSI